MLKSPGWWEREFRRKKALWTHDGDKRRPHALLTGGLHSNGYFESDLVMCDLRLREQISSDLLELLRTHEKVPIFSRVLGPRNGGRKLAGSLALEQRLSGKECVPVSPEFRIEESSKVVVLSPVERMLLERKDVLLCDDVVTTGASVELVTEAAKEAGANVLPYILAIVNRSSHKVVKGRKVLALFEHYMPTWAAETCPLCKIDSVALRPSEHWEALNARY